MVVLTLSSARSIPDQVKAWDIIENIFEQNAIEIITRWLKYDRDKL
jgi:hypothetical protein